MCGIVAYSGPKRRSLPQELVRHLSTLEYRGYDSAGVLSVSSSGFLSVKVIGGTARLAERLRTMSTPAASAAMAHTRWATHGAVTEANASPIVSTSGRLGIVMNGVIENDLELRRSLVASGATFATDCDTETLLAGIDVALDGADVPEAVAKMLSRVEGRLALCVVHRDHPGTLVVARRGCPLYIGRAGKSLWIASDVAAFPATVDSAYELIDGETATLTQGEMTTDTMRKLRRTELPKQGDKVDIGEHGSFFEKETLEQPETIAKAVELALELGSFPDGHTWERLVLLGCGSAFHAALAGKRAFERWARLPSEAVLANEFIGSAPIVGASTLVIAVSQSGETADTIAAAELAAGLGAYVIAVTNVPTSTLARMARRTRALGSGTEVSVASTKAYTAMLVHLTVMAAEMGVRRQTLSAADFRAVAARARQLGGAVKTALATRQTIREICDLWPKREAFLFMGRGHDHVTALEGALKLKELSYRYADGVAAGELKHGTLALIDQGFPVIAIALDLSVRTKMLSAIREAQARGAAVLAIVNAGDEETKSVAWRSIEIPHLGDEWGATIGSVPLQWLALEMATSLGRPVDRPRNLAKSVTVL